MEEISINSQNFEIEVLKSEKPVLLDFWAPWCNPCRMLGPVISEIAKNHDEIKVAKINVDEQPSISEEFNVMSIPTLLIMNNGKVVNSATGFMPKDLVEKFIKDSIN